LNNIARRAIWLFWYDSIKSYENCFSVSVPSRLCSTKFFNITSNKIVEHIKIWQLRRPIDSVPSTHSFVRIVRVQNNAYLLRKMRRSPVVLENELLPFAKRNILDRSG